MKEEKNNNKRNYFIFAVICLVVLLFYNAVLIPALKRSQITDTSYSFFLTQIDGGAVTKAEITEDSILFEVGSGGEKKLYSTAKIDDPDLVSRLHDSGTAEFSGIVSRQSPLQNFLFSWVLPIVFMFCCGAFSSKE